MKKILITGCSSGFGYDAAKYLAENGHHIYATMRNVDGKNAKPASELKQYAESKDLKIEIVEMDVTSDQSVESAMNHIPDVDVLINNAGLGFGGPVEAFSSQEILDQLDLNIILIRPVVHHIYGTNQAEQDKGSGCSSNNCAAQ